MRPSTALLLPEELFVRFITAAHRRGRDPERLLDEILTGTLDALEDPLPPKQCRCCPDGCRRRFSWRGQTRCACPPAARGPRESRGGRREPTDKRFTVSVTPQTYVRLAARAASRNVAMGTLIREMMDLEDAKGAAAA